MLLSIELTKLIFEEFGHYYKAWSIKEEIKLFIVFLCSCISSINLCLLLLLKRFFWYFRFFFSCLRAQGIRAEGYLRLLFFNKILSFSWLTDLLFKFLFWFKRLLNFLNLRIFGFQDRRLFRAFGRFGSVGYLNFHILLYSLIDNLDFLLSFILAKLVYLDTILVTLIYIKLV